MRPETAAALYDMSQAADRIVEATEDKTFAAVRDPRGGPSPKRPRSSPFATSSSTATTRSTRECSRPSLNRGFPNCGHRCVVCSKKRVGRTCNALARETAGAHADSLGSFHGCRGRRRFHGASSATEYGRWWGRSPSNPRPCRSRSQHPSTRPVRMTRSLGALPFAKNDAKSRSAIENVRDALFASQRTGMSVNAPRVRRRSPSTATSSRSTRILSEARRSTTTS